MSEEYIDDSDFNEFFDGEEGYITPEDMDAWEDGTTEDMLRWLDEELLSLEALAEAEDVDTDPFAGLDTDWFPEDDNDDDWPFGDPPLDVIVGGGGSGAVLPVDEELTA
jgi:hypothetical protein